MREKNSFIKYWFIHHYHKCKIKYIKLRVMKIIVSIKIIIEQKIIDIILKKKISRLF